MNRFVLNWFLVVNFALILALPPKVALADTDASDLPTKELIRRLDANTYRERQDAKKELENRGAAILPELRENLSHDRLPVRTFIRSLVERHELADGTKRPQAARFIGNAIIGSSLLKDLVKEGDFLFSNLTPDLHKEFEDYLGRSNDVFRIFENAKSKEGKNALSVFQDRQIHLYKKLLSSKGFEVNPVTKKQENGEVKIFFRGKADKDYALTLKGLSHQLSRWDSKTKIPVEETFHVGDKFPDLRWRPAIRFKLGLDAYVFEGDLTSGPATTERKGISPVPAEEIVKYVDKYFPEDLKNPEEASRMRAGEHFELNTRSTSLVGLEDWAKFTGIPAHWDRAFSAEPSDFH